MAPEYNASHISILKGLEAVRKSPGMYVGDTDKKGFHHLIWEIVDNSVDEAMAGFCTEIFIHVAKDGETISVEDNGRGIPVDMHPTEKRSALEVVLTTLHAGGKFGEAGGTYEASGGLHGVGASCVNALSDSLIAEVCREGWLYRQKYSIGKPLTKVLKVEECKKGKHGTKITWHADKDVFKNGVKTDDTLVIRRIREMAFLNRGLKISYQNDATGCKETFHSTGGIADYTKYLCEAKTACYPAEVIYGEGKVDLTSRPGSCQVQFALLYSEEDDESVVSFCNNIITSDGGTHVTGFKNSLTRVINTIARNNKLLKDNASNLNGDDIREGLTSIVSVRFPRPEFTSQTKTKLGSTEIETAVSNVATAALTSYFDKNAGVLKKIVERAILAQEARTASKRSAELVKRKGILGKNNRMPGKLYDCNTEKKELSELFIVEGDSAAGSAKDGRDPELQAILPVRGKVINAEKNSPAFIVHTSSVDVPSSSTLLRMALVEVTTVVAAIR